MTEEQENLSPAGEMSVGNRLRAAREAAGLSRADIAARTRITERHIAAIEADDFGALAGRTYAIGFSRNYAKAVGLDPAAVAEDVRQLTSQADAASEAGMLDDLEPGDPSRVPTRSMAWLAGVAAFVVVIAGYFAWHTFYVPELGLPSLVRDEPKAVVARAEAAPVASRADGPVVFTASEDGIWVKFYDAGGTQLMQKQMAKGETYTVPADANGPQLWTGRPEALAITIGGQPVPPLADRQMTVRDVPVSAAALLARAEPAPVPVSTASAAGPVGSPAPTRRREPPRQVDMPPPPSPAIAASAPAEAAPAADSTVSD
jgi:transcriptional regulator with XRE-family HTH domain